MTQKKRARKNQAADKHRDMPYREDGQTYGRVTQMLGNGRVLAQCDDGATRLCRIRGSMRKREWVRVGDTVLVALRSFQDDKADVVFKYEDAEVARLRRLGELAAAPQPAADDAVDDELADVVDFEEDEWERI